MDWSEVTARVVVEACAAHPEDVVVDLGCGDGRIALQLAGRVKEVVGIDLDEDALARARAAAPPNARFVRGDVRRPALPARVSVVAMHDTLRFLLPADQKALVRHLGSVLPDRALLVIGDVLWSMPLGSVDDPEQFGEAIAHAPTTAELEAWVREAGFLPDLHRFGVGRAVMIALKAK